MTADPNGLKNVPVDMAAKMLGKSRQFIRVSLQEGLHLWVCSKAVR